MITSYFEIEILCTVDDDRDFRLHRVTEVSQRAQPG